jgi:tryptophanyl-tRNA synthetase
MSNKPVILTGLRANNDLHIGNYFGALLPMIDMAKGHADEYEINLFVPDLHSFTTPTSTSTVKATCLLIANSRGSSIVSLASAK